MILFVIYHGELFAERTLSINKLIIYSKHMNERR